MKILNNTGFYPTLGEAVESIKALGIRSKAVYRSNRHLDPRLPEYPELFYVGEWKGERNFFGDIAQKYNSVSEAASAAQKLGFKSSFEYFSGYWVDPKLPHSPNLQYRQGWVSWMNFLGITRVNNYKDIERASRAAVKLGIVNSVDYFIRYNKDPRLPARPDRSYRSKWVSWDGFLGRIGKYQYLEEARRAARDLGIRTSIEYAVRYKEDVRLPSGPDTYYVGGWVSWPSFLGELRYATLEQVIEATKALGINTSKQYNTDRLADPKLPAKPEVYLGWRGWPKFFKKDWQEKYATYEEAVVAARLLGCKSYKDYGLKCKLDPRLPLHPENKYKNEWKGYSSFLGTKTFVLSYTDIEDARRSCWHLGVFSRVDYLARRFLDPKLSSHPEVRYKEVWPGWIEFLLPGTYLALNDVKLAVKILAIKDSHDYRLRCGSVTPSLPSHPERKFESVWKGWWDFCGAVEYYSYSEAKRVAVLNVVLTQVGYRKYIIKSGDLRLPKSPEEFYGDEWVNWFDFLGKEQPFIVDYIEEDYWAWRPIISDFFKSVRGGKNKHSHLCRFLRHFVQLQGQEKSPEALLLSSSININAYKAFLSGLKPTTARGLNWAVVEFCDYVLKEKLTIEDEETGELIRAPKARNPFLIKSDELSGTERPAETTKCALAFQYVNAAKKWMFPDTAKTFSDLKKLHWFGTDWMDIDPNLINSTDPDCVTKNENGKTKIWCPTYWVHAFALVSVPARGRQLAYNDSGEGDSIIPVIKGNGLVWEDNPSSMRGLKDTQGFIKCYPGNEFGMYFTTNKTSAYGRGYSVPWIPMDLAYWLVRLRCWQQKYNQVLRAKPWIECERTNLNEPQRLAKGSNFFLFREFGREDPGIFGARLTDRLAAALYHSQPSGIILAKCGNHPKTLHNYQSIYTPHSMRVSLITAYVLEFGLSVDIVMKIAGHYSLVMAIYYVKIDDTSMRTRFGAGEKRALKDMAYAAQRMLEQNRVDSIKDELIANDEFAIKALLQQASVGSQLFRDYGICPFGGSRCGDGGGRIGKTMLHYPVPGGYLGIQNCPLCRHFVTGPVFLGGLLSLINEISLQAKYQSKQYANLESEVDALRKLIDKLDEDEYEDGKIHVVFNSEERELSEIKIRKLLSESESAAKKLDMMLCDIQAIGVLIRQCDALTNRKASLGCDSDRPKLILHGGNELLVVFEEASVFRQFNEVCENAEIYESASADLAVAPRSQMLDRMMEANNLRPRMFQLTPSQQLSIGNQLVNMFLLRLKTWERLDEVVDGRYLLSELGQDESVSEEEFNALFASSEPLQLRDE